MRDLLCLLPYWRQIRILELAPVYWNETLQKQEAQEILAENVSRWIAIGELDRHLFEGEPTGEPLSRRGSSNGYIQSLGMASCIRSRGFNHYFENG